MDAQGHGDLVLSAIVAGRGSMRALNMAEARLTAEHFEDERQQYLFTLLTRYAQQTRGIMTQAALGDFLRDKKPGGRAMYTEYYSALAKTMPRGHEFLHSVEQLRVLAARRDTGKVFATGLEILNHGVHEDDRPGTPELRGHEDARSFVLAELAAIERNLRLAESPEGDAHDDADSVMAAYARAKDLQMRGEAPGVKFGIDSLDGYMDGGIGPGEMAIIRAGTGIGKSRFCVNHAWHASTLQGKHVVYFTTETLKPQIDTNLIARHSRLPQFGLENGLNARRIRAGRLTREEESALDMVVRDFKKGDYARCRVVQMPEHCTLSVMAGRYAAIERQFTPDLAIIDYLQLFIPDRSGRESREHENLAGVLKSAERWCGSVNGGNGVACESPWQVNRNGRANLKATGKYTLEDSSGTQEASNTPDIVLDLLDREEDSTGGRRRPLVIAVSKVRDGPAGRQLSVEADLATCYFYDREEIEAPSLDIEGVPGA